MRDYSRHSDITNRKSIDDILKSKESFEKLLGMGLLFNRETEYYKFSGFVTAALLDFDGDDQNILAINSSISGLITFHWSREDLRKAFENCDAFIGKNPGDSFLLI